MNNDYAMTDDQYTKHLVDRIQQTIVENHYYIGKAALEHIICEALWQASLDVRAGKTACLECIGQIRLDDDNTPLLVSDEWLTRPLPKEHSA